MAANQEFLSIPFSFYYGLVLVIMFGYAIAWQQIFKTNAADGSLCQQTGIPDLGNGMGDPDF